MRPKWLIRCAVAAMLSVAALTLWLVTPALLSYLFERQHSVRHTWEDGTLTEATITERSYFGRATDFWGTDHWRPERVITNVEIRVDGRLMRLPASCAERLAELNPTTIDLGTVGSGIFTLDFDGGDAGGSYHVMVVFGATGLSSFRVESGEFPESSFETTEFDSQGRQLNRTGRKSVPFN